MSGRRVLTAEEIFISEDLPKVWVPTPEWKPAEFNGDECGLYVTTLDAREKETWEDEVTNNRGERDASKMGVIMATAAARSCVDESGNRIFTIDQIEKIAKKSAVPVSRIWTAFRKLNTVTDADVSELAKN
jgi:hypothetical protein